MSKYSIVITLDSIATFYGEVVVKGFKFQTEHDQGQMTFVSRDIEADSWIQAVSTFNDELTPILNAMSFYRLSAISAYGASMLIDKKSNKTALLKTQVMSPGTGLLLSDTDTNYQDKVNEIERLADSDHIALYYFRHALLTISSITSATHLLQAAESLAGQITPASKCQQCANTVICANCGHEQNRFPITDHKFLKKLLGPSLYGYYYGSGEHNSIRNKLFHGKPIGDALLLVSQTSKLVERLKEHIISHFSLAHIADIRGVRSSIRVDKNDSMFRYESELPRIDILTQWVAGKIPGQELPFDLIPADQSVELIRKF